MKKSLISLLGLASLFIGPASADIFLDIAAVGGAGDGTAWSSAYTNVADAIAALNAAPAGGRVLRVAKGVYHVKAAQTLSVDGFQILGGHRASFDGDVVRDPEEYQTIFSCLADPSAQAYRWRHVTPAPGEYTSSTKWTSSSLLVNGKLAVPECEGDFDFFIMGSQSYAQYIQFSVPKNLSGRFSGIFFCNSHRKPNISVAAGTGEIEIEDCVFFANYPQGQCVAFGNVSRGLLSGCRFIGNEIPYGGGVLSIGGNVCVSNCVFSGNLNPSYFGSCVASVSGTGNSFVKTTFTRNLSTISQNLVATSYSGASALVLCTAPCIFSDCAFTNNYAYHAGTTDGTTSFPLITLNGGGGAFDRCVFVGNRIDIHTAFDTAYALVGNRPSSSSSVSYNGCLFSRNTLHADADGAYAIGVVGGLSNGDRLSVVNTVFASNTVEIANVAASQATASLSRGPLLFTTATASSASQLGVANCTFLGPAPEGVHDIAQVGNGHSRPLNVANSLFLHDDAAPAVPFAFAVPDLVTIKDCTIKNLLASFRPSDYDLSDGLQIDDVPLGAGFVPMARTPGLRLTADLAFADSNAIPRVFQIRSRGSATWQPLLSTVGTAANDPCAVGDLASAAARPFGAQTRGAVQTLTPNAENGATLTVRRSPLTAGTVSSPSTQAVAAGAPIVPVTATPSGNNSFAGWYEDGNLVSSSPTLEIAALDADRVVTATFATRAVTVVFDLQGKGIFNANGASQISVAAHAGEAFPALPPFTLADGYVFIGTDSFPALVPDTASDVIAVPEIITKDVRVIYAAPEGAGARDGTSWANAYGDLGAAMADAAKWRGEVWLKGGRYAAPSKAQQLPILSNVILRGGFAGNETAPDAADPAANPTVISGDINGDDTWQSISNNATATQSAIWNYGDLTFSQPNPNAAHDAWRPCVNVSENVPFFLYSETAVSNVAFHGITFTGFARSVIYSSSTISDMLVSNCLFVANGGALATISNNLYYHALHASLGGHFAIVDTRFIGNAYCVRLANPAAAGPMTNNVFRCDLVGNYGFGLHLSTATQSVVRVEQCNVVSNGVGTWVQLAATNPQGRFVLADTLFRANRFRNGGAPVVENTNILNFQNVIATSIERCRFEDNVLDTTGTGCLGLSCEGGNYHTVLVRDCAWRGNVINTTGASDNVLAAVGVTQSQYSQIYFYNSSFTENAIHAALSKATARAGVVSRSQRYGGIWFLNCGFCDNAISASGAGQAAEVVTAANINYNNCCFRFVNCAIDTSCDGHKPFCLGTACDLFLHHCAVTGFDAADTGITTGTVTADGVSAEPPVFAPECRQRGDGLFARGLSARSPFTKSGFAVAANADGWIFYYNPDNGKKPWVTIGPGTTCTETDGAAQGLSLDDLVPDAFGNPRKRGKVALGPLVAPKSATTVTFR